MDLNYPRFREGKAGLQSSHPSWTNFMNLSLLSTPSPLHFLDRKLDLGLTSGHFINFIEGIEVEA